jgi:Smg protein
MKENVLDVLMYLFENYVEENQFVNPDRDGLKVELQEAGFDRGEVDKALSWLDGLIALNEQQTAIAAQTARAFRVFTSREQERIGVESQGFLMFLDQIGVLDDMTREKVIDRMMALDGSIELEQTKWVTLMVLFNQPGQEAAFAWMEDLVLDEYIGYMH